MPGAAVQVPGALSSSAGRLALGVQGHRVGDPGRMKPTARCRGRLPTTPGGSALTLGGERGFELAREGLQEEGLFRHDAGLNAFFAERFGYYRAHGRNHCVG